MPTRITIDDIVHIFNSGINWEAFAEKTILVTGAAGGLPSYMIEALAYANHRLQLRATILAVVRDRRKALKRFSQFVYPDEIKIQESDVRRFTHDGPIEFVVHAASPASPNAYLSSQLETFTTNLDGTRLLIEQAEKWKTQSFLFFSSSEVYGSINCSERSIRETDYGYLDIHAPRSCYSEGKRAAETLILCYVREHGFPGKIVRPFHTYGPGMNLNDGRIFAHLVNAVVDRKAIVLNTDGSSVRSFCYISDAATAFFHVLLRGEPGTAFNVGNPDATISIKSLSQFIVDQYCDRVPNLRILGNAAESGDVHSAVPNIDRLRAFGCAPSIGIEAGFKRTIAHYLEMHS